MTAVLLTPPYLQFFDSDGVTPLANGRVYTYTSTGGTFSTPKATYTSAAGTTPAPNPIELNSRGIPNTGNGGIWLSGTYDFDIRNASNVQVGQQLAVTAFTALPEASTAYFESFSGTGAQTAFTTSTDLGTDEKAIFVWVDAGGGAGLEIQNPSAYTINGTTLTFSVAPASGTNNIFVSSPSSLVGAASSAAAAAASSAAAALASETAAAASETAAGDSETAAATSETNAATSETNASNSATLASQWASLTSGQVAATDYSAKAWAIGGTGTTTNNAKYYSEQAAAAVTGDILPMTEQGSTPSTPATGVSKLYFKTDSNLYALDDAANEVALLKSPGFSANKRGALAVQNGTDDGIEFITSQGTAGLQVLVSGGADDLPTWGNAGLVLIEEQTASASATIDFTTGIDSAYDHYIIEIINARNTNNTLDMFMLPSRDGGSTFPSDNTSILYGYKTAAGALQFYNSGGGSSVIYLNDASEDLSNASTDGFNCTIKIFNPSSTSFYTFFQFVSTYRNASAQSICNFQGSAGHYAAAAVNAIRFQASSSTIAEGTFKLYGVS